METTKLKRFAQFARRSLIEQVSAKLKFVLAEDSAARREGAEAIKKLEEATKHQGTASVIERVAYIWFNRFCALRFMDANRYNRVNVVSPADPGQFQPEILAEAKMGHIDDDLVSDKSRQRIFALLDGTMPSRDPQGEAYRLLVVAACNHWHRAMPFLFQRIDDYTELLMPDDLLSGNSILAYTREAMTPNVCEDVEVIGWLYQFYISEKKDEVFDGLKKNKKITPENIPAATQLFTPHWIVRYLVENSLGRLWMLNRPNSGLKERMEYYIEPQDEVTTEYTENTEGERQENQNSVSSVSSMVEKDFLVVSSPEEIKICDPACGSGHMLTYAFDLLYAIYEEEGYEPAEIPSLILMNNLYGIEIDERAGELAAFALTMQARAKQRRFFNRGVKPNICVLENVQFDEGELEEYMDFVGRELFTAPLQSTLCQFEEADNFGSLIRPDVTDVEGVIRILESKDVSGQLFLAMTHQKVLQALWQADYLSPKYHVVIANPPYMSGRNMNGRLGAWLKDNYAEVKSDLFSAFIVRNTELTKSKGQLGCMSPFVWMFISSYEQLREFLTKKKTITSLVQLEYSGFDGATVPICAFTIENLGRSDFRGGYVRLSSFKGSENQGPKTLEAIRNPECGWFYRASATNFMKIPGSPIAYWVSDGMLNTFEQGTPLGDFADVKRGMTTSDNNQFLRFWPEVSFSRSCQNAKSDQDAVESQARWFPYSKGGGYRKWYGFMEFFINWEKSGRDVINFAKTINQSYTRTIVNISYYFLPSVGFSYITSGPFSMRWIPVGFLYDSGGPGVFADERKRKFILACMNSSPAMIALKLLNPTLNLQIADVVRLPLPSYSELKNTNAIVQGVPSLVKFSKRDWDSYETSWDFTSLPLLNSNYRQSTLKATYQKLRTHWREITLEMQRLEEENNRIFIEAYGLQDELTPDVPLNEITLTCNPWYRYNKKSTTEHTEKENNQRITSVLSEYSVVEKSFPIDDELEAQLLADTIRELVSYAVGCMFGRYSLDKPGLILANQGETIEDYHRIIATTEHTEHTEKENNQRITSVSSVVKNSFPPDENNVIPILDGDWFTDDISERFRQFLKVAFGLEHYEENLRFIEQSLNIKGKRDYSIRDYFISEFYADHVRRYKKRPIYWLFSSPKGSFNALIYMHRYRPDTVSVVLNDYLREFRGKLSTHLDHLRGVEASADATKSEKTKALKEIEKLKKTIDELDAWERDVMYPLATKQIAIDLDDGVKVNYPKFGNALKKIPGLEAKGEN